MAELVQDDKQIISFPKVREDGNALEKDDTFVYINEDNSPETEKTYYYDDTHNTWTTLGGGGGAPPEVPVIIDSVTVASKNLSADRFTGESFEVTITCDSNSSIPITHQIKPFVIGEFDVQATTDEIVDVAAASTGLACQQFVGEYDVNSYPTLGSACNRTVPATYAVHPSRGTQADSFHHICCQQIENGPTENCTGGPKVGYPNPITFNCFRIDDMQYPSMKAPVTMSDLDMHPGDGRGPTPYKWNGISIEVFWVPHSSKESGRVIGTAVNASMSPHCSYVSACCYSEDDMGSWTNLAAVSMVQGKRWNPAKQKLYGWSPAPHNRSGGTGPMGNKGWHYDCTTNLASIKPEWPDGTYWTGPPTDCHGFTDDGEYAYFFRAGNDANSGCALEPEADYLATGTAHPRSWNNIAAHEQVSGACKSDQDWIIFINSTTPNPNEAGCVYRTTDGGTTWAKVYSPNSNGGVIPCKNGGRVLRRDGMYITNVESGGQPFFYSLDDGSTWIEIPGSENCYVKDMPHPEDKIWGYINGIGSDGDMGRFHYFELGLGKVLQFQSAQGLADGGFVPGDKFTSTNGQSAVCVETIPAESKMVVSHGNYSANTGEYLINDAIKTIPGYNMYLDLAPDGTVINLTQQGKYTTLTGSNPVNQTTIKFPLQFGNGDVPDDVLKDGFELDVEVKVSNPFGEDQRTASVVPATIVSVVELINKQQELINNLERDNVELKMKLNDTCQVVYMLLNKSKDRDYADGVTPWEYGDYSFIDNTLYSDYNDGSV